MKKARYASYDSDDGAAFEQGKLGLEDLRSLALKNGEPKQISGKQSRFLAAGAGSDLENHVFLVIGILRQH